MPGADFKHCIELLCGQIVTPSPYAAELLREFPGGGLGRSQLNEVLLSVQLDRMDDGLFAFIFGEEPVDDLTTFQARIHEFRIKAAVQFGNFKYAYKHLRHKSLGEIRDAFGCTPPDLVEKYKLRHPPVAQLREIKPKHTYYLGYLVNQELKERASDVAFKKLVEHTRDCGSENHEIYLDYDHLDVYIATSMRDKIDFWNIARFANEIQAKPEIAELKLRFFDPTQAYCRERIDKGIVEGLMLKRAKCTIYLAGETETLGKDSELAATLAQGKTVIAYVPKLESFDKFKEEYVEAAFAEVYANEDRLQVILKFLQIYWPNGAWEDKRVRSWLDDRSTCDMDVILRLLHEKASKLYDNKAKVLKESHPLGLQVNLASGVANGVLVARTVDECAALLRRVVLGELEFRLDDREDVTAVVEIETGSIYRVVTKDTHLTNSFWNFYLET